MSLHIGEDDTLLTTVWLLATLSGGSGSGEAAARSKIRSGGNGYGAGGRSVKKKSLEKLDIVKTCNCIIDISSRVSLRRTSNLMFGTVLAYKGKCLQNWKDVNSCRMLIQRLNRVMGTARRGVHVAGRDDADETNSRGKIQLLRDDPSFDISQGLITEFEGFGRKDGVRDWRDAYEFEVEPEEEEREEEKAMGAEEEVGGTQTEKWEDLEFGFDANGEVVNNEPTVEPTEVPMDEEAIQRSLMEGMENGFEVLPEFDVPLVEEAVEGVEAVVGDVVEEEETRKRKRKASAREPRSSSRRLVIDGEVSLSVALIKTIRDGYVAHERGRRDKFTDGVQYRVQSVVVAQFADVARVYRAEFSALRERERPRWRDEPMGTEMEDVPVFDNDAPELDIEVGRMRAHSRSSSVSSVEEARRAERHSSSFHFDFAGGLGGLGGPAGDGAGYDAEMDLAQLDISFGGEGAGTTTAGGGRGSEDDEDGEEGPAAGLASVEEFAAEAAAAADGDGRVGFFEVAPPGAGGCGRRAAAARFLYVLQLATWGRVAVAQRGGLRGEIVLALDGRVA